MQTLGEEALRYVLEELDLSFPDPGSLERGRFTYFPVVPGRLEFAIELRQPLLRDRPKVVAVELPDSCGTPICGRWSACREMSVILLSATIHDDDRAVYVPVEPADPFTEAMRTADEIGAEIIFVEPDAGERPHLPDAYPDTLRAAAHRAREIYRGVPRVAAAAHGRNRGARRGMAWKLQGAIRWRSVLVVVSLNLLDPVLDAMEKPQAQPMARLRREACRC